MNYKQYNNRLTDIRYHIKTCNDEEQKNEFINEYQAIKLLYHVQSDIEKYKVDKINKQEIKDNIKQIIDELTLLIEK